jgi:hypothetical protein
LYSSPRSLQNKKKFIKIGPIDQQKQFFFRIYWISNIKCSCPQKKNHFCSYFIIIGPILMIFFLFCKEFRELHNKKNIHQVELLDYKLIVKKKFFLFILNLISNFLSLLHELWINSNFKSLEIDCISIKTYILNINQAFF